MGHAERGQHRPPVLAQSGMQRRILDRPVAVEQTPFGREEVHARVRNHVGFAYRHEQHVLATGQLGKDRCEDGRRVRVPQPRQLVGGEMRRDLAVAENAVEGLLGQQVPALVRQALLAPLAAHHHEGLGGSEPDLLAPGQLQPLQSRRGGDDVRIVDQLVRARGPVVPEQRPPEHRDQRKDTPQGVVGHVGLDLDVVPQRVDLLAKLPRVRSRKVRLGLVEAGSGSIECAHVPLTGQGQLVPDEGVVEVGLGFGRFLGTGGTDGADREDEHRQETHGMPGNTGADR